MAAGETLDAGAHLAPRVGEAGAAHEAVHRRRRRVVEVAHDHGTRRGREHLHQLACLVGAQLGEGGALAGLEVRAHEPHRLAVDDRVDGDPAAPHDHARRHGPDVGGERLRRDAARVDRDARGIDEDHVAVDHADAGERRRGDAGERGDHVVVEAATRELGLEAREEVEVDDRGEAEGSEVHIDVPCLLQGDHLRARLLDLVGDRDDARRPVGGVDVGDRAEQRGDVVGPARRGERLDDRVEVGTDVEVSADEAEVRGTAGQVRGRGRDCESGGAEWCVAGTGGEGERDEGGAEASGAAHGATPVWVRVTCTHTIGLGARPCYASSDVCGGVC